MNCPAEMQDYVFVQSDSSSHESSFLSEEQEMKAPWPSPERSPIGNEFASVKDRIMAVDSRITDLESMVRDMKLKYDIFFQRIGSLYDMNEQ
jgi:hypothetical protein